MDGTLSPGRDEERRGTALLPYLAAIHADWLAADPDRPWKEIDGTLVFADVSGFTPLTERLAQRGKVGAEELTDVLNGVFCSLLAVAAGYGGDCLKLGGDALFLLFSGPDHARRAACASAAMLDALRPLRRVRTGVGTTTIGMSVGVHSGLCQVLLAGTSHQELVAAGPGVTTVLEMEHRAGSGEILVSPATAALLDDAVLVEDAARGGWVMRRPPSACVLNTIDTARPDGLDARAGLPAALAGYLTGADQEGEHRLATVGFVQFGQTDDLLGTDGTSYLAAAVADLLEAVQKACAEFEVTLLGTDVDKNAGKIILAAGVPSASSDDEDRMLHTVRTLLDSSPGVPLRAGVARGRVFAVDLGSPFRRSYTVMGDTVNLAARLMAKSDWGQLLVADTVMEKVRTEFELTPLAPFTVKGKANPIHATALGRVVGTRRGAAGRDLPLIGRHYELGLIREALASAHHGEGRIVEVTGEPGVGKSRLLAAVVALNHELPVVAIEGGHYSQATPYFAVRRPLRRLVGSPPGASVADVEQALRDAVERHAPQLRPWLPLLGVPVGLELEDTAEVARLDTSFRQARLQSAVVELVTSIHPGPALITVEDAHWLDAASTNLLEQLLSGVGRRPWTVIVNRRDVAGGLALEADGTVTRLMLAPLGDDAARTMASAMTQGAALPPGMMDELVARSGGADELLQEQRVAAAAGPLAELPDSIEAVVAA